MRFHRAGAIGATLVVVAMLAAACGSGGGSASSSTSTVAKESLTIGSANFPESVALANIYADVLKGAGYPVTVKANLGAREIIQPALQSGQIDVVPEYVGNYLNFIDPKVQGGLTLSDTVSQLSADIAPKGLTLLSPSDSTDADAIAVTKATADKYHLTTISDLGKTDASGATVASQLNLGGPPECATRQTCLLGLQSVYGLHFKGFVSLDAGGPLTKSALANGQIGVARLFSSDEAIQIKGFVILDDDKHYQLAGNIVPVIRTSKVTPDVTSLLNAASKALAQTDLVNINKAIDIDHADPADQATMFVQQKGLK